MKTAHPFCLCLLAALLAPSRIMAHAWHAEGIEPAIVFDESYRAQILADFMGAHRDTVKPDSPASAQALLASAGGGPAALQLAAMAVSAARSAPAQAATFMVFAPKVAVRWDSDFLYIESNGMPAHQMMVGITSWQQQVPLPQAYQGENAWRIPLHPVVAKQPASIKNRFLRGAIALAANGIPIFNPQNNRGEVSQEIGELDHWGGHCGRADDYHYHAAPLHLQSVVGKGQPIAFALDGYPIFGLTEPDGSPLGRLDGLHGHETSIGYHYHASTKYPYVNGGFHGEVVEADGQGDPLPLAGSIREAGSPLRGAKITGFDTLPANSYKVSYEVSGDKRSILYGVNADGTYPFEFNNGRAGTTSEVYTKRQGGGGGPRRPGEPRQDGPDQGRRRGPNGLDPKERRPASAAAQTALPTSRANGSFKLTSPVVADGGTYPVEYTGDGAGSTPPLAWTGAPAGTQSYALIMHHLDPEGVTKWYWTLYHIPADVTHLDKNAQGVGTLGSSFKGKTGYEPPHSKGPGAKTYVITLYALSAAPQISAATSQVTGKILSAALKDHVLASADLSVVYSRVGEGEGIPGGRRQPTIRADGKRSQRGPTK